MSSRSRFVETCSDEVDISANGVLVNGYLLPHSRPAPRDRVGRELAAWPVGRYRLNLGHIWLYAANDRSWDSRYWGPISSTDIVAKAISARTTDAADLADRAEGLGLRRSAGLYGY